MTGDEHRVTCGACRHEYLTLTPESSRCPKCRTITKELLAEQGQAASLIAHKLPGSSGESIRQIRGGDDARVADADLEPSGELRDRIEGRASPKSSSELRSANTLVAHLNSICGDSWGTPQPPEGRERGVDAVAEDADGSKLEIQVTTPETVAWAQLAELATRGELPEVSRSEPGIDQAVEALRRAVVRKTRFSDLSERVLALDATDSTVYALKTVADAFRARYGEWAASVGYQAIWLVGPVDSLVHRLDVKQ